MEQPKKSEHFSHSALDLFARCGEAYRRRYLEGEKIPPGFALLRGTVVHKAAEANYRQKIETKIDLPAEAVAAAARDAAVDAVRGPFQLDLGDDVSEKEFKGKLVDSGVALAQVHRQIIASKVQPVAVEKEMRVKLPGFPREILGFIDVIDSQTRIRDAKTSGKKKTLKDVAQSLQLLLYTVMHHALVGRPPSAVVIDSVVETKAGKRSAEALELPAPPQTAYQPLLNRLGTLQRAHESGVFSPASPDAWNCSPKWCGYWTTCAFRSRVIVPVTGDSEE